MLTRILLAAALVAGPGLAVPGAHAALVPPSSRPAAVAAPQDPVEVSVTDVPVVVPATDGTGAVEPPADPPAGAVVASPEGGGTGADGQRSAPAPEPDPTTAAPDPTAESPSPDSDRLVTDAIPTQDAQTLGLTWPQDVAASEDMEELDIQVRTRTDDEWSAWETLPVEDAAPDAGTSDAESGVRAGTSSLWFGDAEAVQLSFAATDAGGPDDMTLVLVGSDGVAAATTPQPAAAPAVRDASASGGPVVRTAAYTTTAAADAVVQTAAAGAPAMFTRAQWGAAAPSCTPDTAGSLVGAVVHHTAGSNSYGTVAQAMEMIRNDQRYHMTGRGWCDLGYNFVVDKFGNLYEGRVGSANAPVIGVHAGGFNTGTVGVAMLGTYDAAPSGATVSAVARVIGWRLGAYNVDPTGMMSYYTGNGENSKYHNTWVTLPRVFGHRDVSYTACPGNGGYSVLQTIRDQARAQFFDPVAYAAAKSVVTALYVDLLGRGPDPTGLEGWSAALLSGTSQAVLVETLTRSDEYIAKRVAKAYREVLGREPEPVGANDWLVAIRNRQATVDDVQRRFYDSDEYFAASGGTMQGYVQRLYTTMLRRGAGAAEVNQWVSLAGSQGRAWVVDSIWWSVEAATVRSGDYYQTFLGRGPDPTGQAAWAQVLLQNGEGAVRAGIAGSLEYRSRAIARYP